MTDRIFNFSPGPAVLPEAVLQQAREDIWSLGNTGIGVMEHSHRGGPFDAVMEAAQADCRRVAGIGDDHAVLFLQGGASTQFFMLPANFLAADATADYVNTGSWSKKAIKEAKHYGKVHVAGSSEDRDFAYVPELSTLRFSDAPSYLHFTSNNTIVGTEFPAEPTPPPGAFLACDASSDAFSRPIDMGRYGVFYAGAQKNLGPSGVTLVVIRARPAGALGARAADHAELCHPRERRTRATTRRPPSASTSWVRCSAGSSTRAGSR